MIDHVSDSLASKQKKPKELSPRKSKHTTTKVDMELEVIKAVGEGLKNMCSSMQQQQQPQAAKEEKDEDDFFGVFLAFLFSIPLHGLLHCYLQNQQIPLDSTWNSL